MGRRADLLPGQRRLGAEAKKWHGAADAIAEVLRARADEA
jgi:hypothetical protein